MISKAVLEDITSLKILINSAYRGESSTKGWTHEAHLVGGNRTDEAELFEIISDPKNTLLKYTQDNYIIGCMLLTVKENQLYLGMLTVAPLLQNNGIGKKLLAEAENHALEWVLPKIVMTVISIRTELIAYYIRKGYIDTGLRAPFPANHIDSILGNRTLEFVVLEKKIELSKSKVVKL